MPNSVDPDVFRPLGGPAVAGARFALERIPIGGIEKTLQLQRFEVWAPNAEIVLDHGDGKRERIAPPPIQYYRGTVDGEDDSMVFLAVRNDGAVEGMVISSDKRFTVRSRFARAKKEVVVEETSFEDEFPADGGFHCDVEHMSLVPQPGAPSLRANATMDGVAANGTLSPTGTWTLNIALEADFELYSDLGSNAANVTTFLGNLAAMASVVYQRDLTTDIVIAFTRIQTTASDPFNINPGSTGLWNGSTVTYSTGHALAELGDIWASSPPFGGARSSVVLVSGKNQTAGVAWIGTACGGNFTCSAGSCTDPIYDGHTAGPYAYFGLGNQATTAVPDPNATNNGVQYGLPASNYWALLAFTHELGHNVNGPHTHCVALTPEQKTTYGVTRNYVDECVNGCFGGATSVPAEKGTIMSYCHLLGSAQSRFLFGKAGEPSELIRNQIRTFINSRTPASPAISAPASVGIGTPTAASISSPVGGITYNWTIVNGTINGATTGTSINFTGTTNPVTLRVRGTNASGCAASDYVTVTVNSCVAPSVATITSSQNISSGGSVQLNVTANGTGPFTYQWYVGQPGNTSTPAAPGNPINVSPTSSTTYWVRVTGACGSADSVAVLIGVLPTPTATSLYVLTPCRLFDSRGGNALANLGTRNILVAGLCGVPSGAKAVVANLTALAPSTSGFLACFPADLAWPGNSTINYRAGKTRANNAILPLSGDGRVIMLNNGATQDFIIDITGYFQ